MIKRLGFALCLGTLALAAASASAQPAAMPASAAVTPPDQSNAIPLRPAPPGALPEQWEAMGPSIIVRNVVAPTLTPFLPAPGTATGAAVIVAPGGAFRILSMDNEGYAVAKWLAQHGVAAFVLKYRLVPTDRDPAKAMQQMMALMAPLLSNGVDNTAVAPPEAVEDARDAVRLVRRRAAEWGVDPHRVGLIGFSAGAITTEAAGFAPASDARPDFIGPIYGTTFAQPVAPDAPPMFMAVALDDPLMARGDLGLINTYRAANRPLEVHLFEHGGHGFGMTHKGTSSDMWIEEFYTWMADRGLLKPGAQ